MWRRRAEGACNGGGRGKTQGGMGAARFARQAERAEIRRAFPIGLGSEETVFLTIPNRLPSHLAALLSRPMRRVFVLLSALIFVCASRCAATGAQQGEWTLYKVSGRDYVAVENVAKFYALSQVRINGADFTLSGGMRSLRGRSNSVEFFINNLKFNLSYPVVECEGHLCMSRMDLTKLVEPVMRPGRIKNAERIDTVVLDAGHGGHDLGAASPFGYEKDFALDVVLRARLLLMSAGFKVVLTRGNDTFISLGDRVRIANAQKNAIFIAVHFNAGGAGTGLETYTLSPRGVPSMAADGPSIADLTPCPGHQNDAENMALATATHAAMVVRSRMWDRGIKRARFVVIRDITIPGVLVEGGFQTNMTDARIIANPQYRQQMATSILQAVRNYQRAVGTAAPAPSKTASPPPPPPPPSEPELTETTPPTEAGAPKVETPTDAVPPAPTAPSEVKE